MLSHRSRRNHWAADFAGGAPMIKLAIIILVIAILYMLATPQY
jgi:Tfp pilus assembly protein PilE